MSTPPPLQLTASARILLIDLAGIGDLILATPAIHAIRQRYPHNHVALLVASHVSRVLDHCPDITAHWVCNSTRDGWAWWWHWPRDLRCWHRLRRQRFTVAVNLYHIHSPQGSWRMARILSAIRPQYSVGYDPDGKGRMLTHPVPTTRAATEAQHETRHALRLAQMLDAAPTEAPPTLWVTAMEREQALAQLAMWGVPHGTPFVLMAPGARLPDKRWPVEYCIEIARWLTKQCSVHVVMVGDRADDDITRRIARAVPHGVLDVAGKTTLRAVMALATYARVAISNDTGIAHIAAALQRPLVVLFGPTNAQRFGPHGNTAPQHILRAKTPRMRSLPVADVQRALADLLDRT